MSDEASVQEVAEIVVRAAQVPASLVEVSLRGLGDRDRDRNDQWLDALSAPHPETE